MLRELDQHTRELENYTTTRELGSCMWAHKFAFKLIILLDQVRRLSPTIRCCKLRSKECETRRREVENTKTAWFGRFMKLLKVKVHYHEIQVCHMSSWV